MRSSIVLLVAGFVFGLLGGWLMWRGEVFAALLGFSIGLPCGVVLILSVMLGAVGVTKKMFKPPVV